MFYFTLYVHTSVCALSLPLPSPPLPSPLPLQVLLSQTHRYQALELLGRFLDLGPWAVNLALSVGIFPYVLKLLQSKNKELQPILVFIWSKILAVDKVRVLVTSVMWNSYSPASVRSGNKAHRRFHVALLRC